MAFNLPALRFHKLTQITSIFPQNLIFAIANLSYLDIKLALPLLIYIKGEQQGDFCLDTLPEGTGGHP